MLILVYGDIRRVRQDSANVQRAMDYEGDASVESVSEALSYRQRLEKPAGGEVVLMQWSPTMDLLAASFADNSVSNKLFSCPHTTYNTAQLYPIICNQYNLPLALASAQNTSTAHARVYHLVGDCE